MPTKSANKIPIYGSPVAVELDAQSLFRNDPPATRAKKIRAVEQGFSAAGIA